MLEPGVEPEVDPELLDPVPADPEVDPEVDPEEPVPLPLWEYVSPTAPPNAIATVVNASDFEIFMVMLLSRLVEGLTYREVPHVTLDTYFRSHFSRKLKEHSVFQMIGFVSIGLGLDLA